MTVNPHVSTDFDGLTRLRAETRTDRNSPEVLRKVASQFEALFTQMMLKSAREAKLGEGLFDSSAHEHYQGMFDSQIALNLAQGRGLGIADLLVRQLSQGKEAEASPAVNANRITERTGMTTAPDGPGHTATHFTQMLWPHAEQTGQALGVDPRALIAQAALETGWGRATIRHPDGRNSFNVFNIKATPDWAGERVSVPTLEYEDGVAVRRQAEFRSYRSYGEAFADYTRLIGQQPRYAAARAAGQDSRAYAAALQQAGYATDPGYARKIDGILHGEPLARAVGLLKNSSEWPLA
jgi:flagellar protein FlgJ